MRFLKKFFSNPQTKKKDFIFLKNEKLHGFYTFELLISLVIGGFLLFFVMQRGETMKQEACVQKTLQDIMALDQDLFFHDTLPNNMTLLDVEAEVKKESDKIIITIPKKSESLCKRLKKHQKYQCTNEENKTIIVITL